MEYYLVIWFPFFQGSLFFRRSIEGGRHGFFFIIIIITQRLIQIYNITKSTFILHIQKEWDPVHLVVMIKCLNPCYLSPPLESWQHALGECSLAKDEKRNVITIGADNCPSCTTTGLVLFLATRWRWFRGSMPQHSMILWHGLMVTLPMPRLFRPKHKDAKFLKTI